MSRGQQRQRRVNNRLSHLLRTKAYHSIESKLKIFDHAKTINNYRAATTHNVERSNMRCWKKMEAGWQRLPLDDRRSLRFYNSKVTKNEDNFKKLNDWVKDKLNEDQLIKIASLISDLLQIDNRA